MSRMQEMIYWIIFGIVILMAIIVSIRDKYRKKKNVRSNIS